MSKQVPEGVKEKYYEGKGYAGKAYDDAKNKAQKYVDDYERRPSEQRDRDYR